MTEVTTADLKPLPSKYESSRGLFDVLVGEDSALPIIEASSAGDTTLLRDILSRSPWTQIALESQHCIYHEDRPRHNENDVRVVLAMSVSNLERAVWKAAENGHAEAVSILLDFALRHDLRPSSIIGRFTIKKTVENGQAAVFETLAAIDPNVIMFNLGHNTQPLDLAIARNQPEVIEVLLRLGAGRGPQKDSGSYRLSRLSRATRDPMGTRMTAAFLKHGFPVAGSGALHSAASRGALDTMRLLIQHGADVNERLPENTLPRPNQTLHSSWTPMHFAAYLGQADAMKLLESEGAQVDAKDNDGKTPKQLLEEQK